MISGELQARLDYILRVISILQSKKRWNFLRSTSQYCDTTCTKKVDKENMRICGVIALVLIS